MLCLYFFGNTSIFCELHLSNSFFFMIYPLAFTFVLIPVVSDFLLSDRNEVLNSSEKNYLLCISIDEIFHVVITLLLFLLFRKKIWNISNLILPISAFFKLLICIFFFQMFSLTMLFFAKSKMAVNGLILLYYVFSLLVDKTEVMGYFGYLYNTEISVSIFKYFVSNLWKMGLILAIYYFVKKQYAK